MKCSKPIVLRSQAHPCGQCLACRINRRRLWCHRILLEQVDASSSSFVTLTYSDQNLPINNDGTGYTLKPSHLRDFLKRLRRRLEPTCVRYFAVGEYGEKAGKPHYHMAIFGRSPSGGTLPTKDQLKRNYLGNLSCSFGQSRYSKVNETCCEFCELVRKMWGHGNIFTGELNQVTAQYICGYVTKKMTAADDRRLLDGQYPEFARMSLRPGIGAHSIADVASIVLEQDLLEIMEDVPSGLRHGGKIWPLGRYLRQQLRLQSGLGKEVPKVVTEKLAAEMQPLRDFAFNNSRSLSSVVTEFYQPETQRLELLEEFNTKTKRLS